MDVMSVTEDVDITRKNFRPLGMWEVKIRLPLPLVVFLRFPSDIRVLMKLHTVF
jgi:hypothetical protein